MDQSGQERLLVLPGLPDQGSVGGDSKGDRGIPSLSGTGPPSRRATRKDSKDQAALTRGQVKSVLHEVRAAWAEGRGCQAKAIAANLNEKNVVEEGEHDVRQQSRERGAASLPQVILQGRSGRQASILGGGRVAVNWP
jgi:hypothetical protein